MFSRSLFLKILFGKPSHPYVPNFRATRDDTLFFESMTRGVGISGDPGTGKTTFTAMEMLRYALTYPDRPIIALDASSSAINEFITLYHYLPRALFEKIDARVVLDIPGHEEWVVPKPMFNHVDTLTTEEQVQKATSILEEINAEVIEQNPTMSFAIKEIFPELARLLAAIRNEYGESWQITEAKKLLLDYGLLRIACNQYGQFVPEAKYYFEVDFLRKDTSQRERDLRSYTLRSALGVLEPRPLRARYGYFKPTITAKEVIDKGLIYLVSGERLTNLDKAQAFVFWDEFASLRAIINKRTPHDPNDKPVLLIIDEVYKLFEIKGMARALGQISTYFRSRKLMPIIILQSFWQLDDLLKEQFWNLGNLITFTMSNQKDAYAYAQQLGEYDPHSVKYTAPREGMNPTAEPDRGQFLALADFIQKKMKARQMIMRRYVNEQERDPFIRFVELTRDKPRGQLPEPLDAIKEKLLRRRAVSVRDALKEINSRDLKRTFNKRPTAG